MKRSAVTLALAAALVLGACTSVPERPPLQTVSLDPSAQAAAEAALAELKKTSPEDMAARKPHYDQIQQQIEQDMPYIPVLTGGTTSEYNDRKFDGWPTEDDLYAFPAVWSRPDNSVIFSNLKPAK